MITILPADPAEKEALFQPEADDVLVMRDGGQALGWVAVQAGRACLRLLALTVCPEEEAERRFCADSLLRAAASYAANQGAYRLCCRLSQWKAFLQSEGFQREGEEYVLPTSSIVKICKD